MFSIHYSHLLIVCLDLNVVMYRFIARVHTYRRGGEGWKLVSFTTLSSFDENQQALKSQLDPVIKWYYQILIKFWQPDRSLVIIWRVDNSNYKGKEKLRVCPREDRAGVTHAISPISFKLSQFMRINKLLKNPEWFGLAADPWGIPI